MKKPIDERLLNFMARHASHCDAALAESALFWNEVRNLRLSFQRLHRRCQRAEAAASGKLRHETEAANLRTVQSSHENDLSGSG